MKKRLVIAIAAIIIIVVVAAFLFSQGGTQQGLFQVQAKGSISVTLTDEETGKPIGKVDSGYVRVMLGGVDQGYLTDKGELKIDNVIVGLQELTVIIPHYGEKRQFIEVSSGQNVPANIVVDMPNPIFDVTIDCKTSWFFDESGEISVTLTNRGDVASVSTSVLILVYTEEDTSTPIATHMYDFPSLVPREDGGGSHKSDIWKCSAFKYGPKEIITAVIFDGWAYTPQNEQVVSTIAAPSSLIAEVSNSVASYLKNHPEIVVETISKAIIGWFG